MSISQSFQENDANPRLIIYCVVGFLMALAGSIINLPVRSKSIGNEPCVAQSLTNWWDLGPDLRHFLCQHWISIS